MPSTKPQLPLVVAAEWLAEHMADVVICDVRWYLDGRSGFAAYRERHVAGARFIDLDECLAAPAAPRAGRHPLPSPEMFAVCMMRAGIGDGTPVVAYDDTGGSTAARLVWMLRAVGEQAALLDGGLTLWPGPTDEGVEVPRPARAEARFTPRPWPPAMIAEANDVAAADVVIDARAPERYRGDVEPIDTRPGHIPGARNGPWAANLDATDRFHSPADLRRHYEELGLSGDADPVVYCGSGVTACLDAIAIAWAGLGPARLYPGSWSQWSADPTRPTALGDTP